MYDVVNVTLKSFMHIFCFIHAGPSRQEHCDVRGKISEGPPASTGDGIENIKGHALISYLIRPELIEAQENTSLSFITSKRYEIKKTSKPKVSLK